MFSDFDWDLDLERQASYFQEEVIPTIEQGIPNECELKITSFRNDDLPREILDLADTGETTTVDDLYRETILNWNLSAKDLDDLKREFDESINKKFSVADETTLEKNTVENINIVSEPAGSGIIHSNRNRLKKLKLDSPLTKRNLRALKTRTTNARIPPLEIRCHGVDPDDFKLLRLIPKVHLSRLIINSDTTQTSSTKGFVKNMESQRSTKRFDLDVDKPYRELLRKYKLSTSKKKNAEKLSKIHHRGASVVEPKKIIKNHHTQTSCIVTRINRDQHSFTEKRPVSTNIDETNE